jgi:hypothetical protein
VACAKFFFSWFVPRSDSVPFRADLFCCSCLSALGLRRWRVCLCSCCVCAPVPKPRPRFCYLILLLSVVLVLLGIFCTFILFGLWCRYRIFVFNLSCSRNLLFLVLCCLVALPFSAGNLHSCCRSLVIIAEHGPASFFCLKFSFSPCSSVPSSWSPFCDDLFSTSSPPLFLLLAGRTALFLPRFRRRSSLLFCCTGSCGRCHRVLVLVTRGVACVGARLY